MNLKRTFILSLMFLVYPSISDAALPIIDSSANITARTGIKIYIPVKIQIPDNAYIYGNPKGPGTGKPLTVSLSSSPSLKTDPILIASPVRYSPPDDEYVFIYRHQVILSVPVTLISETSGTVSLVINGLMCTDRSCTPFSLTKSLQIEHTDKIQDPSLTEYPPGMIPFGETSKPSSVRTEQKSGKDPTLISEFSFSPVFISQGVYGILPALFLGFLAGLILNFMPCVLPVLAIKAVGIVQNAGTRRSIAASGLSYTAGILLSFVFLAFLLIFAGFRWGSLFQHSGFLIIIILILFAFALSLFGLYDIPVPGFIVRSVSFSSRMPIVDSFSKGFLAAVLATPCSGPLLGSVLAWALTQPAAVILSVFLAIGFGLSAPYLVISLFPSMISFIPKPGEWTVVFERFMGFLLAGSIIYFLSILNRSYFIPVSAMLCCSAFGFWQFGRWGNLSRSALSRCVSFSVLILILTASLAFPFAISPERKSDTRHREYSFQALQKESQSGRLSIVVFTADWCPNCILVEKTVLESDTIHTLLQEKNIRLFYADITNAGTEGEALLKEIGGYAIPFLAVFPTDEKFSHPVCLRDIYTKDDLKAAIRRAEK